MSVLIRFAARGVLGNTIGGAPQRRICVADVCYAESDNMAYALGGTPIKRLNRVENAPTVS
ncbi:hypothetical protein SAMD00023378_1124 [Ralstonia sp. NT80]|nr:hypothetical protein SAMD00023378_1124 [Ralstonia sp. NT80]